VTSTEVAVYGSIAFAGIVVLCILVLLCLCYARKNKDEKKKDSAAVSYALAEDNEVTVEMGSVEPFPEFESTEIVTDGKPCRKLCIIFLY
jgi:hypothetical protein